MARVQKGGSVAPSAGGTGLTAADDPNFYLLDYAGNQWWLDSGGFAYKNGAAYTSGASNMYVDYRGIIWVTNPGTSTVDWWFARPTDTAWTYFPNGFPKPIGDVFPTPNGSYVPFNDTAHCLNRNPGATNGQANFSTISGETGYVYNDMGVCLGFVASSAGDLIQYAASPTGLTANLWARVGGVWYYYKGNGNTFVQGGTGTNPTPAAPVEKLNNPFTGISKTVGSPIFSAPVFTENRLSVNGLGTWKQGTTIAYGDRNHFIYDWTGHKWWVGVDAPNTQQTIQDGVWVGNGGCSGFLEADKDGNIWDYSSPNWYEWNGASWLYFATQGPTLTLPAATGITVASPAFTLPTLKAVSNFVAPNFAAGSPTFTAPLQKPIYNFVAAAAVGSPAIGIPGFGRNIGSASIAVGSPAFTAPTFNQNVNFGSGGAPVPVTISAYTSGNIGTNARIVQSSLNAGGLIWNSFCNVASGDTLLLVWVQYQGQPATFGTISLTWDKGGTNQPMTQVGTPIVNFYTYLFFALVNPTPGIKNLEIRATTENGSNLWLSGVSLKGTVTTSAAAAVEGNASAADWGSGSSPVSVSTSAPIPVGDIAFSYAWTNAVPPASPTDGGTLVDRQTLFMLERYAGAGAVITSSFATTPPPSVWQITIIGAKAVPAVGSGPVSLTVSSPAIGVPVFGRNLATAGLAVGSPVFTAPLQNPIYNLAAALVIGSPAIGVPGFGRNISSSNLTVGSPAFTAPVQAPIYNLSTSVLAVGSPTFSAQVIKQAHALVIPNWVNTSPDINGTAPSMSGATSIGVVTVVPGSPVLGAPAFGQVHKPVAALFVVGSPAIGVGLFGRNIAAANLTVGSPTFTAPVQVTSYNLSTATFSIGSPAIDVPGFGRNLAATNFAIGVLSIGSVQLSQAHFFGAASLAVTGPAISAPIGGYVLAATTFAVAPSSVGTPLSGFVQNYRFANVAAFALGALEIGTPGGGYNFVPPLALATGSLALGVPALVRVVASTASSLATGSLAIGAPTSGGNYAAASLAVGSPAIGSATLNQSAAFAVPSLVVGSPVLGPPTAYGWLPLTLAPASPIFTAPVINQTQVLAIPSWIIANPDINGTAPNMSGATSIGAVALVPTGLTFPVVGLSQRHGLVAVSAAAAGPALDAAGLGVVAGGAAIPVALGSPALGKPSLVAVASVAAAPLAIGPPVFGTPSIGSIAGGTPLPLTVELIEFGAPAITLYSNPATYGLTVASPSIAVVNLIVGIALAAQSKAVASPVFSHPVAGSVAGGDPVPLTTTAPAVGVPAITVHVNVVVNGITVADIDLPELSMVAVAPLRTTNFTTGRSEIGKVPPQLGQIVTVDAADLVIGSPHIGQQWLVLITEASSFNVGSPEFRAPTLGQDHSMSINTTLGRPDFGIVALGQIYSLVARGITVASPTSYWHELSAAVPLVVGRPMLGQPTFLQLTIEPAPVEISGAITHPGIIGIEDMTTETNSMVASVPAVTGRIGSSKVTGQSTSARITGVVDFTKIKT